MILNKHKGEKFTQFMEDIRTLSQEGVFFTDTHAHVHFEPAASDMTGVIERAKANAVNRMVTVGIDVADSISAVKLARKFENVYATVGVHPHDAKAFMYSDLGIVEELLTDSKVLAVGEIGLDYFRNHSPKDVQKDVFLTFLDVAISNHKPVVIHNRDATDDCMAVMDSVEFKLDIPGIIHCYNGDREMLKWALDKGFMISYAGPITYSKAEDLRETATYVPMDRLFIETDCPYLTPSPYRGRVNEPANVIYTAYTISRIKKINMIQLAEQLEQNFQKTFGVL